jgi:hypothetical protein
VSKNWHSQDLVCSLPNLVAGQYYQKGARATPSRTGRGRPVLPRGSLLAPGPGSRPVLPKGSHCDSLQGGQGPAGTPERESAPSGTWQQAGTPEREPAQLPPGPGRGGRYSQDGVCSLWNRLEAKLTKGSPQTSGTAIPSSHPKCRLCIISITR